MSGVFNVFGRFVLILFSSFLWLIVLLNLLTFSGANPFQLMLDYMGYSGTNFEESYFGTSALLNAIADMPKATIIDTFYKCFNALIVGGIDSTIDYSALYNSAFGWATDFIRFVVNALDIILMPLKIIGIFLNLIVALFYDFGMFLVWFCKMGAGLYNSPVITTPTAPYLPSSEDVIWTTSTYFNG